MFVRKDIGYDRDTVCTCNVFRAILSDSDGENREPGTAEHINCCKRFDLLKTGSEK